MDYEKIEISEACLGHDVLVDGESLFTHEYDNRGPEYINNLKSTFILKYKPSGAVGKNKACFNSNSSILNCLLI
mgnify:CR=1 FL=1